MLNIEEIPLTQDQLDAIEKENMLYELERQRQEDAEEEAMWQHNPQTGERTRFLGSIYSLPKKKKQIILDD